MRHYAYQRILLLGSLFLAAPTLAALDADPTACLSDIEKVCAGMENHLEDCYSQRANQLTASCRDILKTAMTFMQDPTGPASCVSDVQRFCPDLKNDALAQCMLDKQSRFSDTCQTYLRNAGQQPRDSHQR